MFFVTSKLTVLSVLNALLAVDFTYNWFVVTTLPATDQMKSRTLHDL